MTTLLECKFGSQVYGTNTPESDIDIGRVLLEPREFIFGIQHLSVKSNSIAQTVEGDLDTREMYLRRFVKLCAQGNPNVIEWLYTPGSHIHFMGELFCKHIWNNKRILLNKKKLVDSHMGFAHSQIIKMRRHERNMGSKRRALLDKYGYDVKFASHAVRLMYQLQDIMNHGGIILPYPEHVTLRLREIKAGEWTLQEFDSFYTKLKEETQYIVDTEDTLPTQTDYQAIAKMLEAFYMELYYPHTQFSVRDI